MKYIVKSVLLLLTPVIFSITLNAQDIQISNGVIFEGEPYLAINPSNSQHIIVAWMGYVPFNFISIKTKVTFDGGITWSNELVIPHEFSALGTSGADPSIEFDDSGNVFLCYIDYNATIDSGAVYIRKSNNGGLTWNSPVEVINTNSDGANKPIDRPWIRIDRSVGSNNGNIYVTTMPPSVFGPIPPPYHPYFIRSTNGGLSFEPWKYIDTTGWLVGSLVAQPTPFSTVSQNGIFYCVYPSWVFSQNINPQFILASTSDGGNSFTHSLITTLPYNSLLHDTLSKSGFPLISNPANDNHLVFLNLLNVQGDADVFMWETFDGGITWSDSIRVNDDPIGNDRMQDLIWADFDTDGDLIVTWRDRRNASDSTYSVSSEIWGAIRMNGSTQFSPNFRLSDTITVYDSVLALAGNDFMCVDLLNDTIYAVWGDTRNGSLNIWFKKMSLSGTVVSINQLSSDRLPNIIIYPNPSISTITIKGQEIKTIFLLNQNGMVVSVYENPSNKVEFLINLSHLSNGVYFLQVISSEGMITKKVIKQ